MRIKFFWPAGTLAAALIAAGLVVWLFAPRPSAPANPAAVPPAVAVQDAVQLNSASIYQGDALIVALPEPADAATFDGAALPFFAYQNGWRAVEPVAAGAAPGPHRLRIRFADGREFSKTVTVLRKKFPLVRLGVPSQINLPPGRVAAAFAAAEDKLRGAVGAWQPAARFETGFELPLADFTGYGSLFGELRQTGSSTIRHLGVDFVAPAGTPVRAVNDGEVVLATTTELYGNLVVLNHGGGIYSLYLHLSRMDAAVGEILRKGHVLGAVGETGYAFAPHLHLSVKINGVSVDPLWFIRAFR